MGVGVEVLQVKDRPEAEPEHDLGEAVALGLRSLLDLVEAHAVDPLGDQHAPTGEPGDHVGHVDERVTAVPAREGALVLGLVLVVQLLEHPLLELGGRGLGVEAGRQGLGQAHDHAGVLHVGAQRLGHARVLDLDRHDASVRQRGAVYLADRGSGRRVVGEVLEQLLDRVLPLLLEHRTHLLPGHRRGGGAQIGELVLVQLPVLGRQELGVDERRELADLHRRALHRPERVHHPLGGLEVALVDLLGGAVVSTGRGWRPSSPRSALPASRSPTRAAPCGGPCSSESTCRPSPPGQPIGRPGRASLDCPTAWQTERDHPWQCRNAKSEARARLAAYAVPGWFPACSTGPATPTRSPSRWGPATCASCSTRGRLCSTWRSAPRSPCR